MKMNSSVEPQLPLKTERLIIRNWHEGDRDLFHLINSDGQVMEFFPFRRNRQESDEMLDWLQDRISQDGYGFTAIEEKATGQCMGFCGLHRAGIEQLFPDDMVEIGWRLAPDYWGKGYATEAARELLKFGFETLELSEIVSFAVYNNLRSISVMKRLGMRHDPSRDFDHPRVPDGHSHLKRHSFYHLLKEQWQS